ncbi:MAG TPA: segregation/condensation protein A [Lachnospiraceae bacterium]|nr:segregation/condensation protein A [Lachnospiraceae bacterium]
MELSVKLPVFEGPLDLLLHLIDKNKIDIYDIPIVMITDQYLEYVRQMSREDLNLMSEFMVMAATLLDIKCRMLLPKETNSDAEEEDPRADLVAQLLEYKMYKYMSYELKDRMADAELMMYHTGGLPREVAEYRAPVDTEHLTDGLTLQRLHEIFRDVLRRQENKRDPIRSGFGRIEKEEISLPDKMDYVRAYARKHDHFTFRALLQSQRSRTQVVVTFLAILELMRSGGIRLTQEETFGEIYIETVREAIENDSESA